MQINIKIWNIPCTMYGLLKFNTIAKIYTHTYTHVISFISNKIENYNHDSSE